MLLGFTRFKASNPRNSQEKSVRSAPGSLGEARTWSASRGDAARSLGQEQSPPKKGWKEGPWTRIS